MKNINIEELFSKPSLKNHKVGDILLYKHKTNKKEIIELFIIIGENQEKYNIYYLAEHIIDDVFKDTIDTWLSDRYDHYRIRLLKI